MRYRYLSTWQVGMALNYANSAINCLVCTVHVVVKSVSSETKHTITMGDFNYRNINWDQPCNNGGGIEESKFLDCVEDCLLTQHVRCLTTQQSILDLVFTQEPDLVSDVQDLGPFDSSDHHLLTWVINRSYDVDQVSKKVYDYSNMDTVGMRVEMAKVDWQILIHGSVDEAWSVFKGILYDLRDRFVPLKVLGKYCKRKPVWMSYRAWKCVNKKNKVYAKYKDSKHPAYVHIAKKTKRELQKAKLNFERKLAENIRGDTKSFFAYVRGKTKSRVLTGPLEDTNGKVIDGNKDMADVFNEYFATVFTNEVSGCMPEVLTASEGIELSDIHVTEDIIRKKLMSIRMDKAPGVDELVPRFLAALSHEISVPLSIIYNRSLREGEVPSDWRDANVSPIFKSGSRAVPGNYRPVSLTCVLCKVLETIIRDRLVDYLERAGLIRDSQHGFRKGRSCLSNLLTFLDQVTGLVDNGCSLDIVYLDLAKAFDKVPHQRLLNKLKAYGVHGKLHAWIADWLVGRRQRVCLQGEFSQWMWVLSGVPQGSVLGPVLFLIFIDDLEDGIKNMVYKFADDTKVLAQVQSAAERKVLQEDLDKLTEWANKWQMSFNTKKCKVMHVGRVNQGFKYIMEGQTLDTVDSEKDLGIMISSDLKSSNQCILACSKANKMLGMIKRTISYKKPEIMVRLYKSLVRPHLEYCVSAWAPHYAKDKELLERVQHRFTRLIKEVRGKDYVDRLKELNLWTLEERRNRADLLELFKMYKGYTSVHFESLFTLDCNNQGTRGHLAKLSKPRCQKDVRKYFFSHRVINRWNALDGETVSSSSINAFKNRLNKIRKTRMGYFMD